MSPKSVAKKYLANLREFVSSGTGLLLWGKNGHGKTGMAVVFAKWARRYGYKVLFMEAAEMKRCVIERVAFDEEETMWERASAVDMLVIDDLGKGVKDGTGFGARMMDQLIRHRSANGRSIIITTNMDLEQLEEELKPSTMHSIKECVIPVMVEGVDRRDESKTILRDLFLQG